uniref:insulin-like 3 (Leydig cell) n=1 Tax=Doryrhamphus excisus TaxID=161450 RepID=UPI0025ADC806|nr:insulin-like 3 (Leydig cell) [Doryrhamphus excisus]
MVRRPFHHFFGWSLEEFASLSVFPDQNIPSLAPRLNTSFRPGVTSASVQVEHILYIYSKDPPPYYTVCAVEAQERIKICGRELIRLAVSSCGNPRLRRSAVDGGVEQHQYASSWADHDGDVYTEEPETAHRPSVVSSSVLGYFASARLRRAVGKISDICCENGCSMKELIQFC